MKHVYALVNKNRFAVKRCKAFGKVVRKKHNTRWVKGIVIIRKELMVTAKNMPMVRPYYSKHHVRIYRWKISSKDANNYVSIQFRY
jgi:hypothetical protein